MEPSAEPTKQPSAWPRVLTGVLSLSLLAGGPLLLALVVFFLRGACEDPDDACGEVTVVVGVFFFVTIPLMVAGAFLALATIVSFGGGRRVMIGLGAAILAGVATLALIVAFTDGFENGTGLVVAIAIAAGFFCLSYRVAR